MSETFIINFTDEPNNIYPSMVGSKASVLKTLYQRKLSIPKGFVVTVHAFNSYLKFIGMDIVDILSQIASKDNRLILGIQQKIVLGDVPANIADAIKDSFDLLSVPLVAVRSSATIEDGEQYSYAGQFESFLNVSKENIIRQVKMCWASFFSSRVMAYSKNSFHNGNMAVLVQEMIEADVSGVCFTLNPVDGDENIIIIESTLGLGDKLVQGMVTPDRYIITKKPLAIQESHIVSNASLQDGVIEEIARVAIEIESYYKKPMDIEFAVKDGRVYILQARPITAANQN